MPTTMNHAQKYPLQTTAHHAPWLFGLAFDAPLIGILKRWPNKLHAVEMDSVIHGSLNRGTFESPCGISGLRLMGHRFAYLWPPRLKGMPDEWERCRDCWEATGKMRPRTTWETK